MADIQHEIRIDAPPARISDALSSGETLERLHGARAHLSKEELRMEFPNGLVFRWKVLASDPKAVVWKCLEGPGDSVGTEATFKLSPAKSGHTLVEFSHEGWPGTHGNFRKCNTRWALILHQLKHEVESAARH